MSRLKTLWGRFEGMMLFCYYYLVYRTSRYEVIGEENLKEVLASDRPQLWSSWHGLNLVFLMYGNKFFDSSEWVVIVVGDDRGDVLAELGRRIGSEPVEIDMAGNPVASGRKLLSLIKKLKGGKHTFLCPDGPDGPADVPKDGIFYIARKSNAQIIPWGAWSKQAYVRKRWDHFLVPFPFAHISVVIGKPIPVDRNADEERLKAQVIAALNDAHDRAIEAAGMTPWR